MVRARGNGRSTIFALSSDIPEIQPGQAEITVGEALDVVFVYETLWTNGWLTPDCGGCIQHLGGTFLDVLDQYFADYRIAIATHAHYPQFRDWENDCDGAPWFAPYEAYTPLLPFQWSAFSDTRATVVAAYRSLTLTCNVPPLFTRGQNATSLYTALLSAIDGSTLEGWRDRSAGSRTPKKAIIFLSSDPACMTGYYGFCDAEAISGFTRSDVIRAAQAKDIQIFAIRFLGGHSGDLRWVPWTRAEFGEIAAQTGGTYYEVTLDLPEIVREVIASIAAR